jgi:hypothetical protein
MCKSLQSFKLSYFLLEAQYPISEETLSRSRLYLACPSGLRKDIGSIGATLQIFFSVGKELIR